MAKLRRSANCCCAAGVSWMRACREAFSIPSPPKSCPPLVLTRRETGRAGRKGGNNCAGESLLDFGYGPGNNPAGWEVTRISGTMSGSQNDPHEPTPDEEEIIAVENSRPWADPIGEPTYFRRQVGETD